ncbi:MAG: winged helix-turn-helix transcriptional regulator [Dehalococcoidia bacterium]|nr:winged helix-turn-helix transcriptional regulator [Dehalococcoidia bacterium]
MSDWSLLTNHANVLLCITEEPDIRLRDLAAKVHISERAVKRIVSDLEKGGYLARERHGRRNHYEVNTAATLNGPIAQGLQLGALISALLPMIASSL